MLSRKKRDAKFLIFQSLYIIAIAILFYKGTDLSLVRVVEANDSLNAFVDITDTIVSIVDIDSLKLRNAIVDIKKDSIIDRDLLAQITQRANENNKSPIIPKTIIPVPIPPKSEDKPQVEKKKESDPNPVPNQEVKEFTNQAFTNPDPDRKMFVYQNGSMIGVVEPGKTRTIRIKRGGKIDYTFSN